MAPSFIRSGRRNAHVEVDVLVGAVGKPRLCVYGLELAGAVELLLLFWIMHFCVQVNLGAFERLVTQPVLDFHEVEP